MNRASILAFGITAAVLAAATWNESTLTADEEAATPRAALVVGNLSVTAEWREVDIDNTRRHRLVLLATGSGKADVTVRLEEMGGNPMSRVVMPTKRHWEKSIALDQAGGTTETDLGTLPDSQTKGETDIQKPFPGSMYLIATAEGAQPVTLWNNQPSFEALMRGIEDVEPAIEAKIDE